MRILTLSYEFPPIGGGGAGVVRGLAAELVKLGHSVDVVTMGFRGLPDEEVVDGIRVRRIDCARRSESKCTAREALRYVLRVRPVVRAMLRANRYDLVHVHFILPDGVVAWQSCVEPRGPQSESVEVRTSHCGMGHHPAALLVIADRLAQAEGDWRHFEPTGWSLLPYLSAAVA